MSQSPTSSTTFLLLVGVIRCPDFVRQAQVALGGFLQRAAQAAAPFVSVVSAPAMSANEIAAQIKADADRLGLRGFERVRFVGSELKKRGESVSSRDLAEMAHEIMEAFLNDRNPDNNEIYRRRIIELHERHGDAFLDAVRKHRPGTREYIHGFTGL